MKKVFSLTLAWLALSSVVLAADRFYVVEVEDNSGGVSYQVLAFGEYQALKSDASLKNRHLSKALRQTRDEWKADTTTRKEGFPSTIFGKAAAKSLGMFIGKEKADTKLAYYVAKQEQRSEKEAGKTGFREKQLEMMYRDRRSGAPRGNNTDHRSWQHTMDEEIKKLEQELAIRKEKDAVRIENEDKARELFYGILNGLTGGSPAPKE